MRDHSVSISRSSLAFFFGTLISRFGGLIRDLSMAFCFGSNPAIAAFMVAFRFASLLRRLLGEGPLPAGFIPYFEHLRKESSQRGAQFFRDCFFSLAVLLVGVVVIFEAVLYAWIRLGTSDQDMVQILYCTMLMLPGTLFICLFGLGCALLQCEKKYFITGVAPVVFNLTWIAAVWWLKSSEPFLMAINMSVMVALAFLLQWLMVVPQIVSYLKGLLSWKEFFNVRLFSQEIRQVLRPLFLSVLGVGAVQINAALDSIFARFASLEGPAYLWYAIRIQQLPLALFGIALSVALFPPLARAIKDGSQELYRSLIHFSLRRSFSLMFPCTVAFLVLGVSGVNLLYGHGDFSPQAIWHTTICLWAYGIGLVPAVFVLLFAPAFYAQKNYRIPTVGALYAVVLNVFITSMLVFSLQLGAFSIAVATSICALFNCLYLARALTKMVGALFVKLVAISFFKMTICALMAGIVTLLAGQFLLGDITLDILLGRTPALLSRQVSQQLLQFLALGGTFSLTFFAYAWMINAEDVLELVGLKKQEQQEEEEV